MRKIAGITFKAAMIREGSWGQQDLGTHKSSMTLYALDEPGSACIEWDIPSLDQTEEIGLTFDVERNLLDYDGVFSLPKEAIKLLRDAGFTVGAEFE